MSSTHMQRLSALDASFLHQEGPDTPMHIGSVMIFEGPPPPIEEFSDYIRSRLALVPRYRQKLSFPPLHSGRPLWVDDPNFNLKYHLHNTALPSPGSDEQLVNLVTRLFSQHLDRSKPLWETYLVHNLAGNRFALINKTHHALVDAISSVDLATVMLDATKKSSKVPKQRWLPAEEPSRSNLLVRSIRDITKTSVDLTKRLIQASSNPERTLSQARDTIEGLGEVAWATLNAAPQTPINVEIGSHRRLIMKPHDLTTYKQIKDQHGATINDVVVAVVTGALSEFLHSRGMRTEGVELKGLVPISVRAKSEKYQLGNKITAVRATLPVYIQDPVLRLESITNQMKDLKESKQAVGAEILTAVENFAPPTVLAQASRINFSTRLFNIIITNIPGSQKPLYLMGRKLTGVFPITFLPKNHSLAIAIISYQGKLNYGLLGDYDSMPDLEYFGECLDRSLEELITSKAD